MIRIALTTKYSAYNFGAVLQTFALQRTIKELGADCIVIDADRKAKKTIGKWNSTGAIVFNIYYLIYKKELLQGYKNFDDFIDSLNLSERYKSYEDLKKSPPQADVYLAGSDQIWNPLDIQENYFLRFVPSDKIKASYAASMGISYIPEGAKRIWKEYLSGIDFLSVREKSAQKVIVELTERRPIVHIDPVMLLSEEDWRKEAIEPSYHKPYILCYILYRPKWMNKWLKKLHRTTGKEIVVISSEAYRNIYHTKMIRDAGPREMLGWLRCADFVISSSFHGVALSIANRKPFYTIVNPNAPARIENILDTFNLKNRIISEDYPAMLNSIDYTEQTAIQERERQKSLEYLQFLINVPKKNCNIKNEEKLKISGTVALVGDKCTGCSVCSYICPAKAIVMVRNDEGFIYPTIDYGKCIKCSKCVQFCHTISK